MNIQKITAIAIMLLVAVISFTKIAPMASDPERHTYSIEKTEDKIGSVMTLSGGSAAASATLSLLPGDFCSPVAEQLAEFATYFLLILSALYLEKFLISISGYITFSLLIPAACIIVCVAIATGKKKLYELAGKLAIFGALIFIIVPLSVGLSDMVYKAQASTIDNTIEEYNNLEIEGDSESGLFNEFTTITTETVDNITSYLEGLMESLAVMIVTACVIPVLVFVFLIWFVKTMFLHSYLE